MFVCAHRIPDLTPNGPLVVGEKRLNRIHRQPNTLIKIDNGQRTSSAPQS